MLQKLMWFYKGVKRRLKKKFFRPVKTFDHEEKGFKGHFKYVWSRFVRRVKIDEPPIFIVGCGHSGTSLLIAILGSHPRIYPVPFESRMMIETSRLAFRRNVAKFNRRAIVAGKRRWIEKTPKHIHHLEKIFKWLPESKIIIILRDGRDVAHSIRRRTGSLEDGIQRWLNDNLVGKQFWQHPNVHVVKYEDIVSDFEPTITKILGFLGEQYDSQMEDFHQEERTWYSGEVEKPDTAFGDNHRQHRNWQINQPLFDGREKWKELSAEELSHVNDVAGPLLAELGYVVQ